MNCNNKIIEMQNKICGEREAQTGVLLLIKNIFIGLKNQH